MKNKIFLSAEALNIQQKVSKPTNTKDFVNYNRYFLESYLPNETFYLDAKTRDELGYRGSLEKHIPHLWETFLEDLAWNSSRLEENRYLFEEAKVLLKKEPTPEDNEDTLMLINHREAIHFLLKKTPLSPQTVTTLHALLSKGLLGNSDASGSVRNIPVKISGSVYLPPAIPSVLEECFRTIIEKAQAIQDPFEQSFFLMVHLPYLQTFEDVNKRTSRLSMNIPLLQHGLCPFAFIDVPRDLYVQGLLAVYELNDISLIREVFIWGYRFSCNRYGIGVNVALIHPLSTKYHDLIKEMVKTVVQKQMTLEEISNILTPESPDEKEDLLELIQEGLNSLHPHSIFSYGLTPEEFAAWSKSIAKIV